MLQEVLLAMGGYPGGAVTDTGQGFALSPAATRVGESERLALERLLRLGHQFAKLDRWCQDAAERHLRAALDRAAGRSAASAAAQLAVAGVVRALARRYRQQLEEVERAAMRALVTSIPVLFADFADFFDLFAECLCACEAVERKGLPQSLDFFFERRLNGNDGVREFHARCFEAVYAQFFAALERWLAEGRLSAVCDDFFVEKVARGGDDFRVVPERLPRSFLPLQAAKKVLFVGSTARILRKSGIEAAGRAEIAALAGQLRPFNFFAFAGQIEALRAKAAALFLSGIVGHQQLLGELGALREVYFTHCGEFFSLFLEEALPVLALPPRRQTEFQLNQHCLPNALLRLGRTTPAFGSGRLRFAAAGGGFTPREFAGLEGFRATGAVERHEGLVVLGGDGRESAVWTELQHEVRSGFVCDIAFRFRPRAPAREALRSPSNLLCVLQLVLQNEMDLGSSSRAQSPAAVDRLSAFLSVAVGFAAANARSRPVAVVRLLAKRGGEVAVVAEENLLPEVLALEDHEVHYLRIRGRNGAFDVYISNSGADELQSASPALTAAMKAEDWLRAEDGKSFYGLVFQPGAADYAADVGGWSLAVEDGPAASLGAGLRPVFAPGFPLSHLIDAPLLAHLSRVFGLVFALKLSRAKLRESFLFCKRYLRVFDPRVAFLLGVARWTLEHCLIGLTTYCLDDVLEAEWAELAAHTAVCSDTEELRRRFVAFQDVSAALLLLQTPEAQRLIARFHPLVDAHLRLLEEALEAEPVKVLLHARRLLREAETAARELVALVRRMGESGLFRGVEALLLRLDFSQRFDAQLG